jgi:hypothetical protein
VFFPLSEVHREFTGSAWTVFTDNKPEAMQVEIPGVLRGARGPGHGMILAQLHGAKPEYTGVVAGRSGTPVYIGNRLLGAIAYRIGQFSKKPIAGITPIEQMLEVRDLPASAAESKSTETSVTEAASDSGALVLNASDAIAGQSTATATFKAMETPPVMSGFRPEAVRLRQQKLACTALEAVALRKSGSSQIGSGASLQAEPGKDAASSASAASGIVPGSAISAQLVCGDLEIAATCTVTYVEAKQLLACWSSFAAGAQGFTANDNDGSGCNAGLSFGFLQDCQHRLGYRQLYRGSRFSNSRRVWREGQDDSGPHHCSRRWQRSISKFSICPL